MNTNTANIWNASRYCERVSKSYYTTGNRRVTLVTNPVTFPDRRKDKIVTTTQIYRTDLPSHDDDMKTFVEITSI